MNYKSTIKHTYMYLYTCVYIPVLPLAAGIFLHIKHTYEVYQSIKIETGAYSFLFVLILLAGEGL